MFRICSTHPVTNTLTRTLELVPQTLTEPLNHMSLFSYVIVNIK